MRRGAWLILGAAGLAVLMAWQAREMRDFIAADRRPPSWDQAIHLEIALDYCRLLAEGRWSEAWHLPPKPGMPPFPPLYHLALMSAYRSADPAHAALWLNWAYWCLLCVCVFGLAFEYRPDGTALAAAAALGAAPAVMELLTTQLIDLSVVAWAAAAYWALLRADSFRRWPGSLAFGGLCALGLLHKWSFFSYLLPASFLALRALSYDSRRLKALAAAAIVAILAGPWYAVHFPVMVPRLFEASSDFAVPVWKGAAFLTYFWSMFSGLGPVLWAFGLAGLVAPRQRRRADQGWLMQAWFATSYVFWAIVPNRQLRFLLPGLTPLAIAGSELWPPILAAALAAAQLFLAANSWHAWVAPRPGPGPFAAQQIFSTQLPEKGSWPIDDILLEAQRRSDPASPVANLTLVANAPYFNGPNFTWAAKRLGLSKVRIRGVNRRLCEFSQFVVLKTGSLGPEGVIGGLPEASEEIRRPKGWFSRAFVEARRWPLADGSQAVLYAQRPLAAAPFPRSQRFGFYNAGMVTAEDLVLDLGAWRPKEGVYERAALSSPMVEIRGLKISRLRIEFDRLAVVPAAGASGAEEGDVRFLKIRRLYVRSAEVRERDLRQFLEQRVPGLVIDRLFLEDDVKVEGHWKSLGVSLELLPKLLDSPRRLRLEVSYARVGPFRLPAALFSGFKDLTVPLDANPETPFLIDIPGITLKDGKLTIP